MPIFDSDWKRLHKKLSRQYELIGLRNMEKGIAPEKVDVFGMIAEIVRQNLSNLNQAEAEALVKDEYASFKAFHVREDIRFALMQVNPNIPETAVSKIYKAIRRRFHNPEREHEYFLYFVISGIIQLKNLSISRGIYLIEIARGRIPRPSRLVRYFQIWRQNVRYNMAKKKMKSNLLNQKAQK